MAHRVGICRAKHVDFALKPIVGGQNPADVLTGPVSMDVLDRYPAVLDFVTVTETAEKVAAVRRSGPSVRGPVAARIGATWLAGAVVGARAHTATSNNQAGEGYTAMAIAAALWLMVLHLGIEWMLLCWKERAEIKKILAIFLLDRVVTCEKATRTDDSDVPPDKEPRQAEASGSSRGPEETPHPAPSPALEVLFVTRGGERFHRSEQCRGLRSAKTKAVPKTPCPGCARNQGMPGSVLVSQWGDHFHIDQRCRSLLVGTARKTPCLHCCA